MSSEIDKLLVTLSDPAARKGFEMEMLSFKQMFSRYHSGKEQGTKLDWTEISPPPAGQLVTYDSLSRQADLTSLNKLAVLKVNGGLGTSMGIKGAKSALETQADTIRVIKKYVNDSVRVLTFNQSRYPRILRDTVLPCPRTAEDEGHTWYPPGHGDLFMSLRRSGVLEQLLSEGKEYLFVSNSDNLGGVVDTAILQHFIESDLEFLMEGGTLVNYDGTLRLLELGQVPFEHIEDFKSVFNFKIFNTNNLWINLKALKRILDNEGLDLDIIEKTRNLDNGKVVIQLETAAGSAIQHFKKAQGIVVPRRRFLPVKNCADLLLVRSDIYRIDNGHLIPNDYRLFQTTPTIKLSDNFQSIDEFQSRFKTIPSISELDHLTVTGDVHFGRACDLRGTVIVAATEGQRIDIPDGSVLEDRA
ncbi:UTP-glucose-1-phosphate uridylyltransferase [Lentinula edodes]|nr:UTP-glucose-1-phosphate uridylyltransferase [Lentinula edodes]